MSFWSSTSQNLSEINKKMVINTMLIPNASEVFFFPQSGSENWLIVSVVTYIFKRNKYMYLCYLLTNLLTFSFIQGSIHVSDHCFRTFKYVPRWPIFPNGCNNMIYILANLQNFHDNYHFISQLWNSLRWFSAWSFAKLSLPIERLHIVIKDIINY